MAAEPPDPVRTAGSRPRLFRGLALALAAVGILALAEVALQLREYRSRRAAHAAWSQRDSGFAIHPFLQVAPKPDPAARVFVNRHGFRGPEIDESRQPGTLRVFALGGSTTYSGGVAYEQSYPARLARLLEARAPHLEIEVQNAACDWYSSQHSLIRYLFAVRRFRPDVVVVFHGVNDLYRGFAPEWFSTREFQPDYSHYLGPLIRSERGHEVATWFPFQQSMLLQLVRSGFERRPAFDPKRFNPFQLGAMWTLRDHMRAERVERFPSLPIFRENLGLLARAVESDGARLILGTQPSLYNEQLDAATRDELFFPSFFAAEDGRYPDLESMQRGMAQFNAATAEVARAQRSLLVDLAAAIPRTKQNFVDDVHMTPAALAIVAERFAAAIERAGYLAAPESGEIGDATGGAAASEVAR